MILQSLRDSFSPQQIVSLNTIVMLINCKFIDVGSLSDSTKTICSSHLDIFNNGLL